MKMTEDESDVFEITDFTTASEWERFIAQLEEVIHEWKLTTVQDQSPLTKHELTTCPWEEKTQDLDFAGFKFVVTHYYVTQPIGAQKNINRDEEKKDEEKDAATARGGGEAEAAASAGGETEPDTIPMVWLDMMSTENDFPPRAHCLCRWFGLRDFLVITPGNGMPDIENTSRMAILLSSINIAINNTTCQVPIFVLVDKRWRRLYQGCYEVPGFRTSYEMVHLKHTPPQYGHISGLLDVFKGKIASHPIAPATIAVRFTYMLQDWQHYSWSQQPPDLESFSGEEVGITEFGDLPFGACEDPISELQLSTTWPTLSEEMIVDNDVYTDLDPLVAPQWSVRVRMTDNPLCLLGDYLLEFVQLCQRKESTDQLLGTYGKSLLDVDDETVDVSLALDRLTKPGLPSLGTVVTKATSKLQMQPGDAPIPVELLNEILTFLFPDAKTEQEKKPVTTEATPATTPDSTATSPDQQSMELFKQFKSCPSSSLSFRLAVCMCIVNHSYGGLRAVAHLWQEIVLEMRYRWENNYTIPDMESGPPNTACSLIHQKFQMLNCCILRKTAREAASVDSPRNGDKLETEPDSQPADPLASCSTEVQPSTSEDAAMATAGSERREQLLRSLSAAVSSSEDEDEFYECQDNEATRQGNAMDTSASSSSSPKVKGSAEKSSKDSKEQKNVANQQRTKHSPKNSDRVDEKRRSLHKSAEGEKTGDTAKETQEKEDVDMDVQNSPSRVSNRDSMMDASFVDSFTHQPEGRLHPHDDASLRLLGVPGERLYVPITQEPALMTEDMLEEHAGVLEKLGTSAEGAHLRARMQSACLLSDMEAFKAANPGAVLADFVRWYSPRDWVQVEEEDVEGNITTTGQLSQRMQIPGNMWVEVWQSAKPVPARRQRRLFDDTKEAEKVLHWLSSLRPGEVVSRLMPMLIHASINKLNAQEEASLPQIKKMLDAVTSKATKVMRHPKITGKHLDELVRQLAAVEVMVTRAQSLQQKFEAEDPSLEASEVRDYVASMMDTKEVSVAGAARGELGKLIHKLFQSSQKSAYMMTEDDLEQGENHRVTPPKIPDFPPPVAREYLLRTTSHSPAPWSRVSPQRLYATLIKDDEFRLAGAFTVDTTFM